jgi:hypothetical protein
MYNVRIDLKASSIVLVPTDDVIFSVEIVPQGTTIIF